MRVEFDGKCPACGQSGAAPRDVEPEDMFPCEKCGVSLVVKATLMDGDTWCKAWLVTGQSEREMVAAQRTKEAAP